jgi:glycosyltransferase involved in cell wall biosynthesis
MTSVHHVSDPRIFLKECGSLARAGFDVYLIAPHDRAETIRDVHIVPFRSFNRRLFRILFSPFLMLTKGLKLKAAIYHLHDPELQITGFLLKLLGKRVVFDSHEMVHMDLGDKYYLKGGLMKKAVPALYRRVEALAVRFFDGFVLAEDGYKDYFFSKHRRYSHKFEFLRNYPLLRLIDDIPSSTKDSGKVVAVYAGKLSWNRGIKELVGAADQLDGNLEVRLIGQWENEEIRQECMALPGWRYVEYLGFLPPADVYRQMKTADIGMCALYPVPNYMVSLPVKALEYMACGLPMVMSDFPVWRQMFTAGALFVDPLDVGAISGILTDLIQNPERRSTLKDQGRRLVETEMSWEIEEEKLFELYYKILGRPDMREEENDG